MPLLPNLPDIPQAQFDRIVAAFPGATAAEKSQSYQNWLTNRILEIVESVEGHRAMMAIRSSLPARQTEPNFFPTT